MNEKLHEIIPKGLLHRLGRFLFSLHCLLVFRSYLRVVVQGRENLPDGPFIICSNHQSHLDAVILAHISARYFSKAALIASKDYWYDHAIRRKLSGYFFKIIPINRKEAVGEFNLAEVTALSRAFLQKGGKSIVILPEGTRSMNGKIGPFKNGIVVLSKTLNLPVVPVYIHHSARYWPKGSHFIKPGRLEVKIGKAIFPEEIKNAGRAELIRERVIRLAP